MAGIHIGTASLKQKTPTHWSTDWDPLQSAHVRTLLTQFFAA
jgi:hypothetical protein